MKKDRPDKYLFDERYCKAKEFHFCYDDSILDDIFKNKKSGSILDLGCGVSGLGFALSERGFNYTGVDISRTAIEKLREEAKKRDIKANFVEADLEDYEINDEYDIIICNRVLQFLGKDGQDKVKEIQRKTKKKGINIVDVLINRNISDCDLKTLYQNWNILNERHYDMKTIKQQKVKVFYMVVKK